MLRKCSSLLLLALVLPLASYAAWTKVQTAQGETDYAVSTVVSVASTHAGSTLVMVVGNLGQTGFYPGTTITDGKGDTWSLAISKSDTGGGSNASASIWYLINAPAAITSITVTSTGGTGGGAFEYAGFEEWTPPAGTVALDVANSVVATVTTTQHISASVTTTGNDMIIAGGVLPGISAVAPPFTLDRFHLDNTNGRGQGVTSQANAAPVFAVANFTLAPAAYAPEAIILVAALGIGTTGGGGTGSISASGCNSDTYGGVTTVGTPCTITPSTTGVVATLQGQGSIACTPNCTSANSIVFTPPASVATHVRQGCPVQPSDSIFNTRVDSLPVHPNNAAYMTGIYIQSAFLNFLPSWGVDLVNNLTTTRGYTTNYTPWEDGIGIPIVPATQQTREGGSFAFDNPTDHHSVRLNTDTCGWYELYGDDLFSLHSTSAAMDAASIWAYSGLRYAIPNGPATDAAGLPLSAVMIHASDFRLGLKHMSRMTLCTSCISSLTHYWPAGDVNGSTISTTDNPSNGSIFRLKSTYNCAALSTMAQNICHGWQQYGLIVADNGGIAQVVTDLDVFDDPGATAAMKELQNHISYLQLEAVDLFDSANAGVGSLEIAAGSAQVNPNNGYVTPTNYSVITVQKGAAVATLPIAVQPVAVGITHPYENVEAGTFQSGYQMTGWVGGSTNQTITWAHVSGPGTITTGGLYRPPAVSATVQTDVLSATAAADSTAISYAIYTVLPQGSNPTNSVRISIGNSSACNTPTCSENFLADLLPLNIPDFSDQFSFPVQPGTDSSVWGHGHTKNNDMIWRFLVPNGNYQITYWGGDACCTVKGTYNPNSSQNFNDYFGAVILSANDSVSGLYDFGLGTSKPYYYWEHSSYVLPTTVTDNTLIVRANMSGYLGVRNLPYISALIVQPDTGTTPHWTIDTAQQTVLTPGTRTYWNCMYTLAQTAGTEPRRAGTLQLRIIDWFTNNKNPNWSVIAGPGSVDANGCYTMPSSVTTTTPVVIQASSADGTINATTTLYIKGSSYQAAIR